MPWGLGVPATGRRTSRATDLAEYADHDWIVNSRNTADEEAVRTLASLVGFTPRVVHRIDSLELVEDLIDAGRGVGLLPLDHVATRRVRVRPLVEPGATLRAYAVVRRGRELWPPLRLVLDRLADDAADVTGRPVKLRWAGETPRHQASGLPVKPVRHADDVPGSATWAGYKSLGPARYELAGPLPCPRPQRGK